MTISTCARFTGGPAPPNSPDENANPGVEIVAHLVDRLPPLGVSVLGVQDIEYAHELRCAVAERTYLVTVAYDWVAKGWWEVSYQRRLSWIRRLVGATEDADMRTLTSAIAAALDCLPGIGEVRWHPESTVTPSREYSHRPRV